MRAALGPRPSALGLLFGALLTAAPLAAQQPAQQPAEVAVTVADRGPGFAGRILEAALASPHVTIAPGAGAADLPRGRTYPATVVVLGRDATVASRVRGDVIVVGGDLFIRPGAFIEGRAVAIGGTATNSTLAIVQDGGLSFRDETFDVEAAPGGGYVLRYRALRGPVDPFALPGLFGFRIPTYDRVNGLTLPFAPAISLDSARIELEPGITYRSHLGAIDPFLAARLQRTRRTRAELWAGRGTFTNDAWIYGDVLNSATSLLLGRDTRNYFRAGRVEGRAIRVFEGRTWEHQPFVGGRWERAWSVGRDSAVTGAPWSVFGRTSEKGMRRPNPRVDDGRLASVLAGVVSRWEQPALRAETRLETEIVPTAVGERRFAQTTLHANVGFPTLRTHRFELEAHGVLTLGDTALRQRRAYLGGRGTLSTLDLLSQGGDQLLFIEGQWIVPFERPLVPVLGPPTVSLIHRVGGAGVGSLPRLEQELGLRLAVGFVRVDALVNPARGGVKLSFGANFGK